MKKILAVLLAVCILFTAGGCFDLGNIYSQPERKLFYLESYQLQILADETFREDTGGSFDLQLTNDKSYISIMAYRYAELPEGTTARDVYDIQNQDIFGKRDAVTTVKETETATLPQGTLIHGVFTAEKDGSMNYYITYLVDLPAQETLAWVLVTAVPSYYSSNAEHIDNMVASLQGME